MQKSFFFLKNVLSGLCLTAALYGVGFAQDKATEEDPSLRTWTNKQTGSTVEARPIALNMKTVKLVTTAKKPITMPLEKLSDEDRAWLEEHKDVIGKPVSEWASVPAGQAALELKGKTYKLEGSKLKKGDGKLNAPYVIFYFSASWCGPCCRNAPHSVENYNKLVKDNPNVEVVMCNMDRSKDDAEAWAGKNNFPWPILLRDDMTECAKKVSPQGIPFLVLCDKDGNPIKQSQDMADLVRSLPAKGTK